MSTISSTSSATSTTSTSSASTVSNDSMTSEDFINLMLTELKNQDPTDPTDTKDMIQSQLQLSTIETNMEMSDAMTSLATSFEQTNLSNAASLIGKVVENGNQDDSGNNAQYAVSSVYSDDGDVYLEGYAITGYDEDTGKYTLDSEKQTIKYSTITSIY